MSFLLDTDVCTAHLKGDARVFNRFLQYAGQLHASVVTVGELCAWTARATAPPARRAMLDELLVDVKVLDVNLTVAHEFGALRAQLLDLGRPTATTDLLIAATAVVHGLTLVTHNTKHFMHVPGLSVADWMSP